MRHRLAIVLGIAATMSSCADPNSNLAPAPTPITIPCVMAEPKGWTSNDDLQLAKELKPLPANSATMRMAVGWRSMFKQAQACAKAR